MKTNHYNETQSGIRPISQTTHRSKASHRPEKMRLSSCKKILLLALCICFSFALNAQVIKTINITAGKLSTILTPTELSTITNLTLTGTIDARDFKTMRDLMPELAEIDIREVTIAAYSGTEGTAYYSDGFPANILPGYAFYSHNSGGKTKLKSILIPESITGLGSYCFSRCSTLTSVVIPSSVTSIGAHAFDGCEALTTISIPSSVTFIGAYTFRYCIKLSAVIIPGSLTSIEEGTFYYCYRLTNFSIPSSVISIGKSAFGDCGNLSSIEIPSSVISIGEAAFVRCNHLTSVTIPSSVTTIGEGVFFNCIRLNSVMIPASVTSIGFRVFEGCGALIDVDVNNQTYSSLDGILYNKDQTTLIFCPLSKTGSITIPSTVTSIEDRAFYNSSNLTSIVVANLVPVDLSSTDNVFTRVNKTACTLYVPVGSKSAYQEATVWKDFTSIVEKDITGIAPIISDRNLTIHPNPTSGTVKLVFSKVPQNETILTVVDVTGKTILKKLVQGKEESIDLSGNPPGIYLIKTNLQDGKVQRMVLK